jgi:hypothetical protein
MLRTARAPAPPTFESFERTNRSTQTPFPSTSFVSREIKASKGEGADGRRCVTRAGAYFFLLRAASLAEKSTKTDIE